MMHHRSKPTNEIAAALSESRRLFVSIGLFSAFVNLLMLTGPIFMLQVYDRVLASRSEATLVALVGITAFLFLAMGFLDYARARVLARAGVRFEARLRKRVMGAILTQSSLVPAVRATPATGLKDLETIQRFASGPGPFAFFDAPWTPVFLVVLFSFHWMLGVLAVVSGLLLFGLALLNQRFTSRLQRAAAQASAEVEHAVTQLRAGAETVRGLGMRDAVLAQTGESHAEALAKTLGASDRGGGFSVATKTLRLFLQSMMLGLGAWLAIHGAITPGVMIAATILLGRALAPVDQAVNQWPALQNVLAARRSLNDLLSKVLEDPDRLSLPAPQALLEAEGVFVAAPGVRNPRRVTTVQGVSFRLGPGEVIGIGGPVASGKTTLAKALVGVWPAPAGTITLGGAAIDQYGEAALARHIGWLPQDVVLFPGTVAANIARFDRAPDAEAVIRAAQHADAHEMILQLPGGYDFQVEAGGAALSGGQRQRIALARAFYREPVVVVLDEPDAHLDAAGRKALARAIAGHKERGGAAIVISHGREDAFGRCDRVYLMDGGRMTEVRAPGTKKPDLKAVSGATAYSSKTRRAVPLVGSKPA